MNDCPVHPNEPCDCTAEDKVSNRNDIERLDRQFERDGFTFQPKASHQKDDCINRSADYDCPNPSTLEAVCGQGSITSQIRCCEDEACMRRAGEMAKAAVSQLRHQ